MSIKSTWDKVPAYLRVTLLLTLINLAVLGIRNVYTGNAVFDFLKSNLFIGALPPLIIAVLLKIYQHRLHAFLFWVFTLLWVLFYPNAPYMISDLIHDSTDPYDVQHTQHIVIDTLIIFSIAMLSLFYGFLSLKLMFSIFKARYSHRFAQIAITITLVLSCLGFYMGREMVSAIKLGNGYLYSWEIFLEPVQIFKAVWQLLFPIGAHKEAYAMMALFGIVQAMLLIMFKDIGDMEADIPPTQ